MILLEILGTIGVFSFIVYLGIFFGNLIFGGPKKKIEKSGAHSEELIDPLKLIEENTRLKGEIERERDLKMELISECRALREYVKLLDDAFNKGDTDFIYHELKTRQLKMTRLPEINQTRCFSGVSSYSTYYNRY